MEKTEDWENECELCVELHVLKKVRRWQFMNSSNMGMRRIFFLLPAVCSIQ